MKVLVTGVKGQLGYDVMNELAKRGYEGVGVDVAEMDITDSAAVEKVMTEVHPDKVVHCAAWTAVDAAEDNQEVCHKVNVDGTANIAKMCGKLDIPMVYISTDYVFDGQGTRPWEPDDPVVEPLNVYGHSKYEGEVAVEKYAPHYYIVRIAWVFGLNGKNFINVEINSKSYKTMVDADGKTDRGKTAVVFDIEDVIKERYLKTVTEKNGRQVMDDNQLLKNQLLMALA